MRVIAGEKRGMRLYSPVDEKVRPTSDKIKGAVFNSIQMKLTGDCVFIDAFGGSGAMGIEALSRGAREAWFFDISPASIALIKKNVAKAGFEDRANIFLLSAQKGMEIFVQRQKKADLIFMDPPYVQGKALTPLIDMIGEKKVLNSEGILMIEHDKNVIMPDSINYLRKVKSKKYGITEISYYEVDNV